MRNRRRVVIAVAALLLSGLLFAGSVGAQEGEAPPDTEAPPDSEASPDTEAPPGTVVDSEMIDALTEEINSVVNEGGEFSADNIDELIGEPGKYDLPPGEIVAYAEDLETTAIPDGDGSSLVGPCMGIAISFRPDGSILDMASDFDDPGPPIDLIDSDIESDPVVLKQAFTSGNPFEVHVEGVVVYAGVAGEPGAGPMDHKWSIDVLGLNLDSGGDPNPKGKNRNIGSVDLSEDLPNAAKINALFRIEGEMTSANGIECSGDGYFKTVGGLPLLGGIGLVLALGFGIGGLFNARPARTFIG
ncbi:MAG: hypothetical protein IH940_06755 [Acidobacteria bacterium]|nr:hypothetical protein [Acidobacteriota bacterium]